MKKLFTSLTVLAMFSSVANAETVTIDFNETATFAPGLEIPEKASTGTNVSDYTFTVDGVSVMANKGTSEDTKLWRQTEKQGGGLQYRVYKGATMTITAPSSIKSISFTCGNGDFSAANVTVTPGVLTNNSSAKTAEWTGDAATVQFVVGPAKNQQINKIVVNYGEGGGGEDPQPPVVTLETTKVANIGAWLVSADPSELYEFENPVTVVYQNGLNTYVQDETGSMFIYGSIPAYTPGQQIPAGFVGNYKDYYSTIELVIPNDDTKDACLATYKAGVDGTIPAPAEVAISAIDGETMGNKYIKLAGVTVSALDGKNFTITQGEATIAGFNKFGVEVANTEEGKTVDVIGLVNWYTAKGATEPTASIYPIEIVAQGGTPVVPTPDENLILSADFENDACGFTFADNVFGDSKNVWQHDAGFSCMKGSAFAGGANAVEGAYLVSPVMDLTNRNEIVLTFKHALGHAKTIEPAEMLSLWVREENMDWSVQLPIQAWPSYEGVSGNFTKFAEAGEYDLDQFKDKKIQLGWKYTSTAEAAPTWEIDAVKVTGKIENAISDIEADVNAPVEYFNLQGVRVANPENGLYIMRQGNKVTKVIR